MGDGQTAEVAAGRTRRRCRRWVAAVRLLRLGRHDRPIGLVRFEQLVLTGTQRMSPVNTADVLYMHTSSRDAFHSKFSSLKYRPRDSVINYWPSVTTATV